MPSMLVPSSVAPKMLSIRTGFIFPSVITVVLLLLFFLALLSEDLEDNSKAKMTKLQC